MQNTKLADLLKKLSVSEIHKFRDFAHSPYFNKNEHVQKLADVVLDEYPHFTSNKLQVENLFKIIFPDKIFKEVTIRKYLSLLYEVLEKYIAQAELEKNKYSLHIALLDGLKSRNVKSVFNNGLDKFVEDSHDIHEKSSDDYYYKMNLMRLQCNAYKGTIIDEKYIALFNQQLQYLEQYYMSSVLWKYIKLSTLSYSSNISINTDKIKQVLKNLHGQDEVSKSPLIQLYKKILEILYGSDETNASVELFLEYMKMHADYIDRKKIRGILFSLAQIKGLKASQTQLEYEKLGREVFLIYNYLLENNLILKDDNTLSSGFFISIAINSINLNELAHAEIFIEKYISNVQADDKINIYNYTYGLLLLRKKQYKDAIKMLTQVKTESLNIYINAKIALSMGFYELNDVENFYSVINSFKVFAHRNSTRLSEFHKGFTDHFFGFGKKMFELKTKSKYDESVANHVAKLKSEINNTLLNPHLKNWFELKLNEIIP